MIRNDQRGVTAPIEYVFTFAIAAILVTGLIIAATNVAGDQRRRTVEAQMHVVAQQVAGSLEDADDMIQSTEPTGGTHVLEIERDLPDQLLGGTYTVRIQDSSPPEVVVSSPLTGDTVSAQVYMDMDVEGSTVGGGTITIEYDRSDNELVVTDD